MIRVTFLIGNGFDIRVGLKTGYREFYKYYTENCKNDLLAQDIDENYEFWSDLELGLGEYTKKVTDEEKFWVSEGNLERELSIYLIREMNRVRMEQTERRKIIASEMKKSLVQFHTELPKIHQNRINKIYNGERGTIYSFISFNYTNVFDRCLQTINEFMPNNVSSGAHNEQEKCSFKIEDIIHIHGTVLEEMVLGVNDESQLANERFRKNELYRQCIIKEESNKRLGNLNIERATDLINASDIICVFGMSIGKTDKMWWKNICKWLQDNGQRVLIIYKWSGDNLRRYNNRRNRFSLEDLVKERFKENAGVFDDEWNQVKEQICVKVGSNIFGLKVTE